MTDGQREPNISGCLVDLFINLLFILERAMEQRFIELGVQNLEKRWKMSTFTAQTFFQTQHVEGGRLNLKRTPALSREINKNYPSINYQSN